MPGYCSTMCACLACLKAVAYSKALASPQRNFTVVPYHSKAEEHAAHTLPGLSMMFAKPRLHILAPTLQFPQQGSDQMLMSRKSSRLDELELKRMAFGNF